jgi:hypothetical protein
MSRLSLAMLTAARRPRQPLRLSLHEALLEDLIRRVNRGRVQQALLTLQKGGVYNMLLKRWGCLRKTANRCFQAMVRNFSYILLLQSPKVFDYLHEDTVEFK